MKSEELEAVVKYSTYHKEKSKKWQKDISKLDNCTKAQGNREISVCLRYLRSKQQARERLRSEEGYALSVQRMIEPESVFGQMGIPAISASQLAESKLRGRMAFTCP
ncbi:transposase [Cohnella sp. LGH]|uniref:transposase n=1 Tax=Cohnella sp. LGH TaxID=1619153 RepID=UPI001FFDFB52|nr:transposase [Cohnella sp. LGH]